MGPKENAGYPDCKRALEEPDETQREELRSWSRTATSCLFLGHRWLLPHVQLPGVSPTGTWGLYSPPPARPTVPSTVSFPS